MMTHQSSRHRSHSAKVQERARRRRTGWLLPKDRALYARKKLTGLKKELAQRGLETAGGTAAVMERLAAALEREKAEALEQEAATG